MNPVKLILIPKSSQPPTIVPSTHDNLLEEIMEILQEIKYMEGEIRESNFVQPSH